MTYDQLCDLGHALERDERCARAEAIIAEDREVQVARVNNAWHVDGRYYANASDAAFWRVVEEEKRRRYAERVRRYLAQRLADRVAERVDVTPDTYREALALLGGAWDRGAFCRFRRVLEYVANVDIDRGENELARWFTGRRAWQGAQRTAEASLRRYAASTNGQSELIHAA
jgi:hypothetical protein